MSTKIVMAPFHSSLGKEEEEESSRNQKIMNFPSHKETFINPSCEVFGKTLNKNLELLTSKLTKNAELEHFVDVFPGWAESRERSIKSLTVVADNIDEIHRNSNIAKTASCAAGIVSNCISIAGIIVGNSSGAGQPLQIAGGVGSIVSSMVGAGTSLTEPHLIEKKMDKAKQLLKKDREYRQLMQQWLDNSQDMIDAIDKICNLHVIQDIFQTLVAIIPLAIDTYRSLSSQVHDVVAKGIEIGHSKKVSKEVMEKIIFLCIGVCRNPEMIKSLKQINELIDRASVVQPLITTLVKLPFQVEYLSSVCSGNTVDLSQDQAAVFGTAAALNILIDTLSLTKLAVEINKCSKSHYSVEIRKLRDLMSQELHHLSSINEAFKFQ